MKEFIITWMLLLLIAIVTFSFNNYLYNEGNCIKCSTEYSLGGAWNHKQLLSCENCGFSFHKIIIF